MNKMFSSGLYSSTIISQESEEEILREKLKTHKQNLNSYLSNINTELTNKSSICHTDFLKFIFNLYTINQDENNELKSEINKILDFPLELIESFIPQLVGFYILHLQIYPKTAKHFIEILFKISKHSLMISHLIIWNLLSCKTSYREFSSLEIIKKLIYDTMNNWDYKLAKVKSKPYISIFDVYDSFDDFINKNLIMNNNLQKHESFVTNNKIIFRNKTDSYESITGIIDSKPEDIQVNGNPMEHYKWKNFSSTLNFINDMITLSQLLKRINQENRNKILKNSIQYINRNSLPSNISVPIPYGSEALSFFSISNEGGTHHKILRICEDYACCLSTKEKVPFHVVIEFAENLEELKNIDIQNFHFTYSNTQFMSLPYEKSKSKEAKSNSGFFSSFLNCCNFQREDILSDEEEKEEEKITGQTLGLFGDSNFSESSKILLEKSSFVKFPNRKIVSLIVKGGEDMRQDQFINQIIDIFISIFDKENIDVFLKPVSIITTGVGGIIQTLTDTTPLQKINSYIYDINIPNNNKSYLSYFYSSKNSNIDETNLYSNLKSFFIKKFGNNTDKYKHAVKNFIKSLAAYSLLCYVLEIKDRNNGNILVDDNGHLIHIDFGFLLNSSPGKMNFEKAPFKFTPEFLNLIEGVNSDLFREFKQLFFKSFLALRNNFDYVISFIEIYMMTNSDLPCFNSKENIILKIQQKMMYDIYVLEELNNSTDALIFDALDNWRTKLYDNYQKYCVGVN